MSRKTFALIFALFIIAFVLVLVSVYSPTSNTKNLNPQPTPTVKLLPQNLSDLRFGKLESLRSPISTISAKNVYSLPIEIDTYNKVSLIQLELSYDPKMLEQLVIIPGNFFKTPKIYLNQIIEEKGRISYAIGSEDNMSGVTGKGTVANVSFQTKIKPPIQTRITFLPKTLVRAIDKNESVLRSRDSVIIIIDK